MAMHLFVCLLFFFKICSGADTIKSARKLTQNVKTFTSHEDRLRNDLFRNYSKEVKPAPDEKNALKVDFGVAVVSLNELNFMEETLSLNLWYREQWMDSRLAWDPANYDGIHVIRVSSDRLWKPRIRLLNELVPGRGANTNMLIFNSGVVLYIPPTLDVVKCQVTLKDFPYDRHICTLLFGSTSYSKEEVVLGFYEDKKNIDLSDFIIHSDMNIIDAPGRIIEGYDSKQVMKFDIHLARKSGKFVYIYVVPAVIVSFLVPFMFCVPSESDERTKLILGVMILYSLMFMWTREYIKARVGLPLLLQYYGGNIILAVFAWIISIGLESWYKRPSTTPPPNFLTKIVQWFPTRICFVTLPPTNNTEEDDSENSGSLNSKIFTEWRTIIQIIKRIIFICFFLLSFIMAISMLRPGQEKIDQFAIIMKLNEEEMK